MKLVELTEFIIKELEGKTRKDKLVVIVEHYI